MWVIQPKVEFTTTKVVRDIFNTDLPPASAPAAKK
jgi:hypothetical protein